MFTLPFFNLFITKRVLFLLCLALPITSLSAKSVIPKNTKRKETPHTEVPSNSVFIGITGLGIYYIEDLPPPTDSEQGFLGGANVGIVSYAIRGWLVKFNSDLIFGNTKYVGATQDGSPIQSTTHNFIAEGEGAVGYVLSESLTDRLAPYLGFGSHFWNRGLTGSGGYTEHYLFFYVPFGIRYEASVSEFFKITLDAAYLWNLGGTIAISDMPGTLNVTGSLGSAGGFKIKGSLNFLVSPGITLTASPFFEYFKIGAGSSFNLIYTDGSTPDSAHEPASSSYFYGATLGATFTF